VRLKLRSNQFAFFLSERISMMVPRYSTEYPK